MGFVLIEKTERHATSYPAVHINKSGQGWTNPIFLKAAGIERITKEGEPTVVKFNLFFDKDTSQLAIKLCEDGGMVKQVNRKRGQIFFYLKTVMKEINLRFKSGAYRLTETKHPDLGKIWVSEPLKSEKFVKLEEKKIKSIDLKVHNIIKKNKDKKRKMREREKD